MSLSTIDMLTKKKVLVDVNDSSDEEYEEPTQEQEMEMHGIDLRSTLVCLSELAVKYAKMGTLKIFKRI